MQTSALHSAAVSSGGGCLQADAESQQATQDIEIVKMEMATLANMSGAAKRTHDAEGISRSRIVMDRLPGTTVPQTALQIWRINGQGCLAPRLQNPDVVCYMNSTISCLLICRDYDQEAMLDWGLIDELFRLAATKPIDALPALACMRRVFPNVAASAYAA